MRMMDMVIKSSHLQVRNERSKLIVKDIQIFGSERMIWISVASKRTIRIV